MTTAMVLAYMMAHENKEQLKPCDKIQIWAREEEFRFLSLQKRKQYQNLPPSDQKWFLQGIVNHITVDHTNMLTLIPWHFVVASLARLSEWLPYLTKGHPALFLMSWLAFTSFRILAIYSGTSICGHLWDQYLVSREVSWSQGLSTFPPGIRREFDEDSAGKNW